MHAKLQSKDNFPPPELEIPRLHLSIQFLQLRVLQTIQDILLLLLQSLFPFFPYTLLTEYTPVPSKFSYSHLQIGVCKGIGYKR